MMTPLDDALTPPAPMEPMAPTEPDLGPGAPPAGPGSAAPHTERPERDVTDTPAPVFPPTRGPSPGRTLLDALDAGAAGTVTPEELLARYPDLAHTVPGISPVSSVAMPTGIVDEPRAPSRLRQWLREVHHARPGLLPVAIAVAAITMGGAGLYLKHTLQTPAAPVVTTVGAAARAAQGFENSFDQVRQILLKPGEFHDQVAVEIGGTYADGARAGEAALYDAALMASTDDEVRLAVLTAEGVHASRRHEVRVLADVARRLALIEGAIADQRALTVWAMVYTDLAATLPAGPVAEQYKERAWRFTAMADKAVPTIHGQGWTPATVRRLAVAIRDAQGAQGSRGAGTDAHFQKGYQEALNRAADALSAHAAIFPEFSGPVRTTVARR